ncbi:Uncharacterized protein DAT39_004645, partial [Clarias magur]
MIYELCSRSSAKCVMYDVFAARPPPAQPRTREMRITKPADSPGQAVRFVAVTGSLRLLVPLALMMPYRFH